MLRKLDQPADIRPERDGDRRISGVTSQQLLAIANPSIPLRALAGRPAFNRETKLRPIRTPREKACIERHVNEGLSPKGK